MFSPLRALRESAILFQTMPPRQSTLPKEEKRIIMSDKHISLYSSTTWTFGRTTFGRRTAVVVSVGALGRSPVRQRLPRAKCGPSDAAGGEAFERSVDGAANPREDVGWRRCRMDGKGRFYAYGLKRERKASALHLQSEAIAIRCAAT